LILLYGSSMGSFSSRKERRLVSSSGGISAHMVCSWCASDGSGLSGTTGLMAWISAGVESGMSMVSGVCGDVGSCRPPCDDCSWVSLLGPCRRPFILPPVLMLAVVDDDDG